MDPDEEVSGSPVTSDTQGNSALKLPCCKNSSAPEFLEQFEAEASSAKPWRAQLKIFLRPMGTGWASPCESCSFDHPEVSSWGHLAAPVG